MANSIKSTLLFLLHTYPRKRVELVTKQLHVAMGAAGSVRRAVKTQVAKVHEQLLNREVSNGMTNECC